MRLFTVFIFLAAIAIAQTPQDDKRLVFSTWHGGDRNDTANAVVVDGTGFIYVTGETESRNLSATPVGGKPLTAAVFRAISRSTRPEALRLR